MKKEVEDGISLERTDQEISHTIEELQTRGIMEELEDSEITITQEPEEDLESRIDKLITLAASKKSMRKNIWEMRRS